MIAYILFIGFCAIARLFVDYESWGRLVAAVTCSSWFFAMADSYSSDVEYMQEYVDITINYARTNLNSINTIISGLHERITQLKKESENESAISDGERLIKDLEDIKPYFQGKENEMNKKQSKIRRHRIYGALYTIAGYFAFFVIMTFNSIATVAESTQDFLTVFAFASILMTQFVAALNRDENTKKRAEFEEIIQHFKSVSARYEKKEH